MSGKCGMRNSGSGIAVRGGTAARSAAGTTQRVRLGDVAEEIRENWSGPTADVPVVGLEHIEPDEVWLRKWEVNPDENTFSKAFRKGQLLFGRRRAYQKKLSLAPSDGICSGDITVIAAKSDKVVPSLLPFLLRTDKFFDHAIQGSAGSLSPRVKWAHLAKYEFDLPPMDEQKKLAELLWAANDLKESYKKAIIATDEMLKAKFREMFGDAGDDSSRGGAETRSTIGKVKVVEFGEVAIDFRNGLSPSRRGSIHAKALTLTAVTQGVFDPTQWKDSTFDIEVPEDKYICSDDFYICRGNGNKALVGMGVFSCENHDDLVFPDTVIAAKIDTSKIMMPFLAYAWNSDGVRQQVGISAKTSSGLYKVNQERLSHIQIPLPPLSLQREFVAIADKAESAKANLKKSIAAIDQVMKGLIND